MLLHLLVMVGQHQLMDLVLCLYVSCDASFQLGHHLNLCSRTFSVYISVQTHRSLKRKIGLFLETT